jgi:hypothetical protein
MRTLVFVHRWLGVALCAVFLLWFPSGIGMMYWDYPSVSPADRLRHAAPLDPGTIRLSPAAAYATLQLTDPPPPVVLNTFNGHPAYRFRFGNDGEAIVLADTGDQPIGFTDADLSTAASRWTGQASSLAQVETLTDVDQWTVQNEFDDLRPLRKFSWPNGEQVYVSENTGEVVQYTTRGSRLGAYVGAIPHWLYFTPLRRHGETWTRLVVWSSAIGAVAALLGIVIGLWRYSPSRRYRKDGAPTSIPYRGQKRLHTIVGLVFGIATITWAASGMLSMDPFPWLTGPRPRGVRQGRGPTLPAALRSSVELAAFDGKSPTQALAELPAGSVKQLEFTAFAGHPHYLATLADDSTRIVPVDASVRSEIGTRGVIDFVQSVVPARDLASAEVLNEYDRYYLDRRGQRPLPIVRVTLTDADQTRYYIDPRTGRLAGVYSDRNWVTRWLYHGLHSLDFPWLYAHRPLWDIVVITFMGGGTLLGVTSLILTWRVLGRTLARPSAPHTRVRDDLA